MPPAPWMPWPGGSRPAADRRTRTQGRSLRAAAELRGEEFGDRSSANMLIAHGGDACFRVDRHRFALRVRGQTAYRGLIEEIAARVDAAVGGVPLAELMRELMERYQVAESSIRTYAGTHPFHVEEGVVRRRPAEVPSSEVMASTRSCFWWSGRWWFRTPVDKDLLRGSGRPIPKPLADYLGLKQGEMRRNPDRQQGLQGQPSRRTASDLVLAGGDGGGGRCGWLAVPRLPSRWARRVGSRVAGIDDRRRGGTGAGCAAVRHRRGRQPCLRRRLWLRWATSGGGCGRALGVTRGALSQSRRINPPAGCGSTPEPPGCGILAQRDLRSVH